MRIVVNDIAASQGGAMTVLKQFYNYVRQHDSENEWIFLLGDRYLEETESIRIIVRDDVKHSGLKKIWFDCISGRRFINALKPDVVFSLQNIITFGIKAPQVVYVHQSIPFQSVRRFSFFKKRERFVAFYQYGIGAFIKQSVKRANKVIVQTRWMQQAVAQKTGISPRRILVAAPGFSKPPLPQSRPAFDKHQFFYPTSLELYKNTDTIVEACNLLNAIGYSDFQVLLTVPVGSISHPNIACIGYVPYEEMAMRYLSSTLLFPSYIETVGLPLLEAASLGGLILCSDCVFSREVLASYENAFYFDPFSPEQTAQLMRQVIDGAIHPKDCALYDYPSDWGSIYRCLLQN